LLLVKVEVRLIQKIAGGSLNLTKVTMLVPAVEKHSQDGRPLAADPRHVTPVCGPAKGVLPIALRSAPGAVNLDLWQHLHNSNASSGIFVIVAFPSKVTKCANFRRLVVPEMFFAPMLLSASIGFDLGFL